MTTLFHDKLLGAVDRLSALPISNIRFLLESEFDFLEEVFKPLVVGRRLSFYKEVHSLLDEAGHVERSGDGEFPSLDTVRMTYGRICRARNKRKGALDRSMDSLPPNPAPAVDKAVPGLPPKAASAPSISLPKAVPGAVPDWNYMVEEARLAKEGKDAPWTDTDEKIYQYVEHLCAVKYINMKTEYYKVDKLFNSSVAKSVVSRIFAKRTALGM